MPFEDPIHSRSQTAEGTAALRASHFLHAEHPLIFEDPFAIELIGPEFRERCHAGGGEMGRSGNAAVVCGRCRYAEDQLEAAVRSGVDQYVVLGAGLDTFALRRPDLLETIRVYEIDKNATQTWKRECLAQLFDELPAALEFVPADLEHETVAETLARSSFSSDRRAFFSWLGTTMYLTREAVFRTLESIAAVSAPGSEIVFDYRVPIEFVAPEEVSAVEASWKGTAEMGEPQFAWFNPQTFPNEVVKVGFELVESLSPKQLEERYFTDRSDGMRVMTHHHYIHLRTTT